MQYIAQIDLANDREVINTIVLPDGVDPLAYVEALGLPGTWQPMSGKEAGKGMVHVEGDGFFIRWFQITGAGGGPPDAESGFPEGYELFHNGLVWRSTVDFNIWEPGAANWHRKDGVWVKPTGATDAYPLGAVVKHLGTEWESTLPDNVWVPGSGTGWRDLNAPVGPEAWVQPTGAHDAYSLDALVTHNGQTWRSTVDANVWVPGEFGWTVV